MLSAHLNILANRKVAQLYLEEIPTENLIPTDIQWVFSLQPLIQNSNQTLYILNDKVIWIESFNPTHKILIIDNNLLKYDQVLLFAYFKIVKGDDVIII